MSQSPPNCQCQDLATKPCSKIWSSVMNFFFYMSGHVQNMELCTYQLVTMVSATGILSSRAEDSFLLLLCIFSCFEHYLAGPWQDGFCTTIEQVPKWQEMETCQRYSQKHDSISSVSLEVTEVQTSVLLPVPDILRFQGLVDIRS